MTLETGLNNIVGGLNKLTDGSGKFILLTDGSGAVTGKVPTALLKGDVVDMGLPSGTLWARCDIDVTKPNGFCDSPFVYEKSFFSWGNVDAHNPKQSDTSKFEDNYNWGGVNDSEPYYQNQPYGSTPGNTLTGNIPVGATYDAARANLGGLWRMPTNAEFGELFNQTYTQYIDAKGNPNGNNVSGVSLSSATDKRVTVNGIVGLYIQSKINGNRLFFSCSGCGAGASRYNRGSIGYYWSSTWDSARSARNARYLFFYSGGVGPQNSSSRYFGYAVRPVQ